MNFEQVDAAMGKKDGKYALKVTMKGKADSPDAVQYSKDKGKPSQQVYVTDGPGRRERVKVMGNFPDLTQMDLEQLLIFKVHAYISDYDQKKYYSAFCDVPDDRQGPTTEPTPNTRYDHKPHANQPPQRAATPAPPDWDAKDLRIVRQNTLNRAVDLYRNAQNIGKAEQDVPIWPLPDGAFARIIQLAEEFKDFVYNGPLSPGDQFAREQGLPTAAEEGIGDIPPF